MTPLYLAAAFQGQRIVPAPDTVWVLRPAADLGRLGAGEWTAIITAIAAIGAVAVAVSQLWQQRVHTRDQAAFEHLRRISGFVRDIVRWDPIPQIQKEIINFYEGAGESLSEDARDYMSLLTELDLLAFAAERGVADQEVVTEYTKTMYQENVVSTSFIKEFHRCCGEENSYKYLLRRLTSNLQEGDGS